MDNPDCKKYRRQIAMSIQDLVELGRIPENQGQLFQAFKHVRLCLDPLCVTIATILDGTVTELDDNISASNIVTPSTIQPPSSFQPSLTS